MRTQTNCEIWLLIDSSGFGGIETHIVQLAQALKLIGRRVRVVFYASYGVHPLRDKLDRLGIQHMTLGGSLSALCSAIALKPYLLHTHGYKAGILGRFAAAFYGVPVVSTFHSGEPGSGRVRLYRVLDNLTAPLGEAIAVSASIRKDILGRAHLINNFISLPPYREKNCATQIAFVGRLSPEKGPDLFCRLAKSLPQANFVIYGDGPMREELENRYGMYVRFFGQVNDMEDHWKQIGLLCVTSRFEGLPYAVLEAMAHGIPVAANDVGCLAEVIDHGKNGWIVKPGSPEAFGQYLKHWTMLSDDENSELSRKARKKIEQNYSAKSIMQKVLDVYGRAVNGKAPPRTVTPKGERIC